MLVLGEIVQPVAVLESVLMIVASAVVGVRASANDLSPIYSATAMPAMKRRAK